MGAYQMVLTSTGSTYIFEAQYCYKFVAELESSSLDYFQIPGAPNPEQIKAVVWAPDQFVVFSTAP